MFADALLEVYGVWETPPRQGKRGRYPLPRKYPPPDLCYAVVVKERDRGRVVNVTTRVVYSNERQVIAALKASPVSTTINTYGVERNNLTIRQHSRRMGRKVNAFSKERDYLEHQLTLAFASAFARTPPDQRSSRFIQKGEARDTRGGSGSHRSCVEHG